MHCVALLAKTTMIYRKFSENKSETSKQEVRFLNLFSSRRRLKSPKTALWRILCYSSTCLSVNISLQTNKIANCSICGFSQTFFCCWLFLLKLS